MARLLIVVCKSVIKIFSFEIEGGPLSKGAPRNLATPLDNNYIGWAAWRKETGQAVSHSDRNMPRSKLLQMLNGSSIELFYS